VIHRQPHNVRIVWLDRSFAATQRERRTLDFLGAFEMNENDLKSPHHDAVRGVLRIGGPIVALTGLIFTIVGIGSFFASFGTFEMPRYFWCAFVGMPLLAVGLGMCKFGYLGAITRYLASETAPVSKDAINHIGQGIQPGVKAISRAATEGIVEGLKKEATPPQAGEPRN
jgi:hypothetical protein